MSGTHSNARSEQPRRLPPGEYGCHPAVPVVGAVVVVAGGLWFLASSGRDQLVAAALALVGLAVVVVTWGWRRRLSADHNGMTLRGISGSRRINWGEVHLLHSVVRTRYGISGTTVEIDLDDEGVIVLSRIELGADPTDAANELNALRAG